LGRYRGKTKTVPFYSSLPYASSNFTWVIYLKSLINVNQELTHELLEMNKKLWRHYFSKSQGVLVDDPPSEAFSVTNQRRGRGQIYWMKDEWTVTYLYKNTLRFWNFFFLSQFNFVLIESFSLHQPIKLPIFNLLAYKITCFVGGDSVLCQQQKISAPVWLIRQKLVLH
jgi:hypothetical protein